jgi:hypothetical protein
VAPRTDENLAYLQGFCPGVWGRRFRRGELRGNGSNSGALQAFCHFLSNSFKLGRWRPGLEPVCSCPFCCSYVKKLMVMML